MSVIRFTQVALLLVLIIMNRLAAPRTVDSGSKLDKSERGSNIWALRSYYLLHQAARRENELI